MKKAKKRLASVTEVEPPAKAAKVEVEVKSTSARSAAQRDDDEREMALQVAELQKREAGKHEIPTPSLASEVEWEAFDIPIPPGRETVNCIHELVKPKGYQSLEIPEERKNLDAKKYPYTLDTFQRR